MVYVFSGKKKHNSDHPHRMSNNEIYIQVDNGRIEYGFYVYYETQNNAVSVKIPAYNIYFTAPSKEEGLKRAKVAVRNFCNMWLEKEGWRKFIRHLHTLGFRPKSHDLVMSKLLKRQPVVVNLHTAPIEGGELE